MLFRSGAPLYDAGPVISKETNGASISNVLCGYFEGKTISLSSNTLSTGEQIKFAVQYIALDEDNTFKWEKASATGPVNHDAWNSGSVTIRGTFDTTKRHLLFFSFMTTNTATVTQAMCDEIKTLIRIT